MDGLSVSRQNHGVRNRVVWLTLAATTLIYGLTVVRYLSWVLSAWSFALWGLVIVPSIVIAGAIIMWLRPENPIGRLLTLAGIVMFVIPTTLELPTVVAFADSGAQDWMWAPMWLSMTCNSVAAILLTQLTVQLPDGKYRYPRERILVRYSWAIVILPALTLLSNELVVTHSQAFPGVEGIASPVFIPSLEPLGPVVNGLLWASYSIFVVGVVFQYMRYRKASTRERKQVRWVLFAGVVAAVVGSAPFFLGEIGLMEPMAHGAIEALASTFVILFFAASVVISVLEPAWLDVDIVIRRSFVYGALSFVILVLYIGVAASLGLAAGARLDLKIAVVLTVVIALLFQPARRRLQTVADRWVFGARPTKYEAVTEFRESIDQGLDPRELLPSLTETIAATLRVDWVVATLDDGGSAAAGEPSGPPALTVPIGAGGENVGEIRCGGKREGSIDDEEVQLVQTLATQVGLAVMNGRLANRIVQAAEAERRRIERNIHDGAQQELVALVARLGMARSAATNGGVSETDINELQHEARRILSDLRDLAQGIHPSVLSDGGIVEAVEDRCARLPIEVSLRVPGSLRSERFDDDVEGAAYFFITESLTNVLKHAGATRADVALERDNGYLTLRVSDDGQGFEESETPFRGLEGLRDRFQALQGTVTVSSRPGSGTQVEASLPVR